MMPVAGPISVGIMNNLSEVFANADMEVVGNLQFAKVSGRQRYML